MNMEILRGERVVALTTIAEMMTIKHPEERCGTITKALSLMLEWDTHIEYVARCIRIRRSQSGN